MKFYVADLHFGHANVIKHDGRPYSNVDEMDEDLIKKWNSVVKDTDEVYIIGDFTFRNGKPVSWYAKQLKGKKYLILGNHDKLDNEDRKYFEKISKSETIYDTINGEKVKIVLHHFPMAEWDGFFRGSYHIYAHIHNNKNNTYMFMKTLDKALNAGCMINGYKPVTLVDLIKNNAEYNK